MTSSVRVPDSDQSSDSKTAAVLLIAAAAAVFVCVRVALLLWRDIGLDEAFTVWIARKPLREMFATLRLDSGPPLFYLLVRAWAPFGFVTLTVARAVSMVASIAALAVIAIAPLRNTERALVMLLVALSPLHLFYATEARTYALCALVFGLAAVSADRWIDGADRRWLVIAAAAILAGAYSHYYGVYLFPAVIAIALLTRSGARLREAFYATGAMAVLWIPGLLMMRTQPQSAIAWMRIDDPIERLIMVVSSFIRLGFDGRQTFDPPGALMLVRGLSLTTLVVALWYTRRSPRALRFAAFLIVPIGSAIVAAMLGYTAYFPLRFESTLTVIVALWFCVAVSEAPRAVAAAMLTTALSVGAIGTLSLFARSHQNHAPELVVARAVHAHRELPLPLVATGHSLLYLTAEMDASWHPPVQALPAIHARHAGAEVDPAAVARDLRSLPPRFVWIGDLRSPAFTVLHARCEMASLSSSGSIVAASVSCRP
jgi:hypothetical protein